MSAVGLAGVFKYGGKFLTYFAAVVLTAGVLIGGGAYFASTGGVDLGDPAFGSLLSVRAGVGTVILALGLLVALAGLFGLIHKALVDAATVAVATTPVLGVPSSNTASNDETGDRAAETDEIDGTAAETDEQRESEAGNERASEAPDTDEHTGSGDGDWRESEYVTGTRPGDDDAHSDGLVPDDVPTVDDGSDRGVWTPPDPAEFEQSSASKGAEAGDERQRSQRDPEWDDGGPAFDVSSDTRDVSVADAEQANMGDAETGEANTREADSSGEDKREPDVTLADEGLDSFEVNSGDDPLGDRLSGSDS